MTMSEQHTGNVQGNIELWKLIAVAFNIAAVVGLILSLGLNRDHLLDGVQVFLIQMTLCGFALASLSMSFNLRVISSFKPMLILLPALLALLTGFIIPTNSSFGAAFPSSFLTAGVTLIVAYCSLKWAGRSKRSWLRSAWSEMTFMITLLPITASLVSFILMLLGWSVFDAIPSGTLIGFFANPFIAYWRAIQRMTLKNPSV